MSDLRQAAQQALEALEELDGLDTETECVTIDVGEVITALQETLAQEHALHDLARLGQEIEQEPSAWRDMVVVTLVREGINKHRARELADHFAAQRLWQGLTDEEMSDIVADMDVDFGDLLWKVVCLTKIIEAKLKELNHG